MDTSFGPVGVPDMGDEASCHRLGAVTATRAGGYTDARRAGHRPEPAANNDRHSCGRCAFRQSEIQDEAVSATAGDTGHGLVRHAFLQAEDGVAVLGDAVEHGDLARAAGAFAAGAGDVRAGAVDDVEDAVV